MNAVAAHFDTRFRQMADGRASVWPFAYERQVAYLEALIRPGMTVLDVGCGPSLPYRADRAYVIGLDPSAASLEANTDVDERIVGSGERIPLPTDSVDLAVAFYSVHHITKSTLFETQFSRSWALSEIGRVVKPGGSILIFEMDPWPLAAWAQQLLWPLARRLLGDRLDTYFDMPWLIGRSAMTFDAPPLMTFPPIFTCPWLKIPRCLYPLTPVLYEWRV